MVELFREVETLGATPRRSSAPPQSSPMYGPPLSSLISPPLSYLLLSLLSPLCPGIRVLELVRSDWHHDPVQLGLVPDHPDPDQDSDRDQGGAGLWSHLRLDWVRHWSPSALRALQVSRMKDEGTSALHQGVSRTRDLISSPVIWGEKPSSIRSLRSSFSCERRLYIYGTCVVRGLDSMLASLTEAWHCGVS